MFFFKTRKSSNNKKQNTHNTKKNNNNNITTSNISSVNELDKYRIQPNNDITKIKYWELPNRKRFYNWVDENFSKYQPSSKAPNYKTRIPEHFNLTNFQRISRDYLQDESPMRGILLYYGLGSGKTCTAITIAEAILSKKQIVIFSKTSLESNWVKEFRVCGADYVKNHNHWVFKKLTSKQLTKLVALNKATSASATSHSNSNDNRKADSNADSNNDDSNSNADSNTDSSNDDRKADSNNTSSNSKYTIYNLIKELGIPISIVKANGGVFLVDYTNNTSNFNKLDTEEHHKLDIQIESMLKERIEFVHSDNTRISSSKLQPELLHNKIVIWDEVHNLGNLMVSNSENAKLYYNMFMNAKNVKIIFLSGTPIINRIFEITKIYNILRGYMEVIDIQFKSTLTKNIDYDKIKNVLSTNKYVDQITFNKGRQSMSVSKNPENFITSVVAKGVVYKPLDNIDITQFETQIKNAVRGLGYTFNITVSNNTTAFPEDEEVFENMYYNREQNTILHPELIRKRISGLTSYYGYQDKNEYPELIKPINIIQVPMTAYQLSTYERFRHKEIEMDKNIKKSSKPDEETMNKSSYRLKSRLACSFVFPEAIGNPYDIKTADTYINYLDKLDEKLEGYDKDDVVLKDMKKSDIEGHIKTGYKNLLYQERAKYLDIKNGSLAQYSPKYLAMLLKIKEHAPKGKIFIYSFFRELIGLNSFSYALLQMGGWSPFRIKKVKKQWMLDMPDSDIAENYTNTYKFIFYTGEEDSEMLEIYRKIMNSDWSNMSSDCALLIEQLQEIHPNNYKGELIKMIMTTKKGVEGLDLKEIRFIHIMEPYWQPVLIEQVIGRGVRNKSHLKLEPSNRTVEVFIYMATIPSHLIKNISYIDVRNDIYKYPNNTLRDKINKVITSDEHLYLTSERKKLIIYEFYKLMKDSAFDCALNYKDNKMNPDNSKLVCVDYSSNNRNDYIYTPNVNDTGGVLIQMPAKIQTVKYGTFTYKEHSYYHDLIPDINGKMYIYDENPSGKVRKPKPVGEIKMENGKYSKYLYK